MTTANCAFQHPIPYPFSLLCHVAFRMAELKYNETGYLGSENKGVGVRMSACTSSNFFPPHVSTHCQPREVKHLAQKILPYFQKLIPPAPSTLIWWQNILIFHKAVSPAISHPADSAGKRFCGHVYWWRRRTTCVYICAYTYRFI